MILLDYLDAFCPHGGDTQDYPALLRDSFFGLPF
jgi:hypothetical protein